MASDGLSDDTKNWVQAVLAQKQLKDGILPWVEPIITDFHKERIGRITKTGTCDECTTTGAKSCQKNVCNRIRDEIERNNKLPKKENIKWINTDAKLWSSNPWEAVKCFMPTGHKYCHLVNDIDCSGILAICIYFKPLAEKTERNEKLFEKNIHNRNNLLHSGDQEITKDKRTKFIEDAKEILVFLQKYPVPENSAYSTSMAMLQKLDSDGFILTREDVMGVMKDKVEAIRMKLEELALNQTSMMADVSANQNDVSALERDKVDLETYTTQYRKLNDGLKAVDSVLRTIISRVKDAVNDEVDQLRKRMEIYRKKNVEQSTQLTETINKLDETIVQLTQRVETVEMDCASLTHEFGVFKKEQKNRNLERADVMTLQPICIGQYHIRCPTDKYRGCNISAICHSQECLVMADEQNRKLKLFHKKDSFEDSLNLDGEPLDLCTFDSNVYVCLRTPPVVLRVTISPPSRDLDNYTFHVQNPLELKNCSACWGITSCNKGLCVSVVIDDGRSSELRIIDENGSTREKIDTQGDYGPLSSMQNGTMVVMSGGLRKGHVGIINSTTWNFSWRKIAEDTLRGITNGDEHVFVLDSKGGVIPLNAVEHRRIKNQEGNRFEPGWGICYLRENNCLLLQKEKYSQSGTVDKLQMSMQCWLCPEVYATRRELKSHVASVAHKRLEVICPWCGEYKVSNRVGDLKKHVQLCHAGLDSLVAREIFTEGVGFYFALHPEDYGQVIRPVSSNHPAAIQAMEAVRAWTRIVKCDKPMLEWERGWKGAAETPLYSEPASSPTLPDTSSSPMLPESARFVPMYSPTRPELDAVEPITLGIVREGPPFVVPAQYQGKLLLINLNDKGSSTVHLRQVINERATLIDFPAPPLQEVSSITFNSVGEAFEAATGLSPTFIDSVKMTIASPSSNKVMKENKPLKERARNILRYGAMPLIPPARRTWQGEEVVKFRGDQHSVVWPPRGWEEMSPARRLQVSRHAANLLDSDGSGFPITSDTDILDKYNFLILPNTLPQARLSSAQRTRVENLIQVRDIALGLKTNETLLNMYEAMSKCRDTSTDRHIKLLNQPLLLKR